MKYNQLISQRQLVERLADHCKDLNAALINAWCRKAKPLLEKGEHYIARTVGRRDFKDFPENILPYVHRVYYYDQVRHFDDNIIVESANLMRHKLYHIFFEQHPSPIPCSPLHNVVTQTIKNLDKQMDDIVIVKDCASVFGGRINAIALVECVDHHDLALFLGDVAAETRKNQSTSRIHWRKCDAYYFDPPKRRKRYDMKAYVAVSVVTSGSDNILTQLYEKIKSIDQVTAVSLVFGDAELFVTVEAPDLAVLTEVISGKIRESAGVTATRSYIVMQGYDYVR